MTSPPPPRFKSMRVAHVLRKLDPAQWGGTETALQRMFDGLRENGVHSVVYCPRLEQNNADDPLVRAGFRVERFRAFVPVLGMPRRRKRQLVAVGGNLLSFDLLPSLRREEDISIIHCHTLGRIAGISLTAARKRRLPFVVSIHGGVLDLPEKVKKSFNESGDGGLDWGKVFGVLFRSHRVLSEADAIVTCNTKEAALLREQDPARRVVVQPHGVPVEMYRRDHRDAARAAFPQIQGREVLLSLGRVDPIKNQHWLLDQAPAVFRAHPNAILVLAGACTDEPYGKLIHDQLQALGLQQKVLLTGGLPQGDPRLIGLLQNSSVLLLPSLSETFGLVLLEAWAAGTMVISSRTSGASALIQHGYNGWLFDLDDPAGFHKALDWTLTDTALCRQMVTRGAKRVEEEFSIRAVTGKMKGLYEELQAEPAKPA